MNNYNLYWGDTHVHGETSYGKGSLERTLNLAKGLAYDFIFVTPQAAWHDMPQIVKDKHEMWEQGFERVKASWDDFVGTVNEFNEDGKLIAIPGYEWHSIKYGDYCVIGSDKLNIPDTLEELREFCESKGALLIPHHVAYKYRGTNWGYFVQGDTSPVVEVCSGQGLFETDRGIRPPRDNSFGPILTRRTIKYVLNNTGYRFGFCGGSDTHYGFPGGPDTGITGVLCNELTRESILEAFRARRTIASTGPQISIELSADGRPIGSDIDGNERIQYDIYGRGPIEVEVISNGWVVGRIYAAEDVSIEEAFSKPVQARLQWGWGPWKKLGLDRIARWDMSVSVSDDAKIIGVYPLIQSNPFTENGGLLHNFSFQDGMIGIQSCSGRQEKPDSCQSVVIEIDGNSTSNLIVAFRDPYEHTASFSLAELHAENQVHRVREYPFENWTIDRLLAMSESRVSGELDLTKLVDMRGDIPNHLYFRVKQIDQLALSSPFFFN